MDSFNFCLLMNLSLLNVWKMAHCKQNSRRLLSSFTAGILFVFAWQVCDMVFLHHLWMKCFSWAHWHLKLIYFALGFFWLDIRFQNLILFVFVLFCLLIFVVIVGILPLYLQLYGWCFVVCHRLSKPVGYYCCKYITAIFSHCGFSVMHSVSFSHFRSSFQVSLFISVFACISS